MLAVLGIFLALFGIALLIFVLGWRVIPAEPLHLGQIKFLGRPTNESRKAGWVWLFPGFYSLILHNAEKKFQEFVVKDIYSNDQVQLEVPVSITWKPDPSFIFNYHESGGEQGVRSNLESAAKEVIRHWTNQYGWKTCIRAQDKVTRRLVSELTNLPEDKAVETLNEKREAGASDMGGLGILVTRVKVPAIRVVSPEMKEEVEALARINRERETGIFHHETLLKIAKLVEAETGGKFSAQHVWTILQEKELIERGRGFTVFGLSNFLRQFDLSSPTIQAIIQKIQEDKPRGKRGTK